MCVCVCTKVGGFQHFLIKTRSLGIQEKGMCCQLWLMTVIASPTYLFGAALQNPRNGLTASQVLMLFSHCGQVLQMIPEQTVPGSQRQTPRG